MKKYIILFLSMLLITSNAYADKFEDAQKAFKSGNYSQAIKLYEPLALNGDVRAQDILGSIYRFGIGVSQDYAEAFRWEKLAASQGDAQKQYWIGVSYETGYVTKDYAEAVKWYKLSAEQGYAKAQFSLGSMFDNGLGVTQDYAEAFKWYKLAAAKGNTSAKLTLGIKYYDGQGGVSQDYVTAHMWFNLAAEKGNKDAIKYRDLVAAKMTQQQIADAQKLAREW